MVHIASIKFDADKYHINQISTCSPTSEPENPIINHNMLKWPTIGRSFALHMRTMNAYILYKAVGMLAHDARYQQNNIQPGLSPQQCRPN